MPAASPESGTPAPLDHLGLLARFQNEFLAAIAQVDPRAPVPWCGRWRVRNLVVHLARIHHWAAAEASRSHEVPLGRGPFDLAEVYDRCARELRDTLAALGPDSLASTLDGPGPASFWHRRQTHETLVHLWDLRTAGELALAVEPHVWADTVDEVVTVMQPRQVRLGRMTALPARVRLVAADAGRAWDLHARADAPADPAVVVTGPAEQLALALWRRPTRADRLSTTGDGALLRAALAEPLTP